MKIYYKIGDTEIGKEDFAQSLNDTLTFIHKNLLISIKHQIMWALRNLESDLNNSDGIIIIDYTDKSRTPIIEARNFDTVLDSKIKDTLRLITIES